MNFPLEAFTAVSAANPWTYVVFGAVGFCFGYILEMAGFGDSRKLAAQFYFREMTVLKVMFTAIAVAMTLLFGAVGLGLLDFSQVWVNPTYLGSGVVGGLIMGVGFIIGGYCPTTSLASASTGKIDGMLFMLGGFVGALLFGETEAYFDHWYTNAGYYGRLTLDQVFGVPAPVLVPIIVAVALLAFWGGEHLEQVFGRKDPSHEPAWRKFGAVGLLAVAVGVLALGSPTLDERYQKLSFKRTEMLKQAEGKPQTVVHRYSADEMLAQRLVFVSPAEAYKARYLQAINPVYLDVRSEADYNLYHLVDSTNVPLSRLASIVPDLLSEPPANTVFITIANDEAAAVQAWKLLVASKVPNVYVLEGGINHWIKVFGAEDTPPIQPLANAGEDQLRYAFPAALGSRYKSCGPSPIEYEKLSFQARIVLQLKRDKSGGGCG
ncbi:MAG: YeeE/YedE family protein [Vitreoscilla sp.]|nr:YeeE/YedE family protein [Burkholderiales bacterium]MBP6337958.1 YeeE/YedE family protein [Vitreoscilla sp.]MBP6677038.1 YeeE/YedE family protein [Vitreoscilla sp.]